MLPASPKNVIMSNEDYIEDTQKSLGSYTHLLHNIAAFGATKLHMLVGKLQLWF